MKEKPILPASWDVPQIFRDRLGSKVGRQRAMLADGHLLLVLHAPPGPDQVDRQGRFFWRKPDATWISDQFGAGPGAVIKHLDQYGEQLDKLDRLEESAQSSHDYFEVLEGVAPLQRAARNQHSVMQEARTALPDAREIIDFRDRAYVMERSADLLITGTQHGLDFAMAKQAEQQASSSERMAVASHRLNILAAFFFPLATLCAIFGMDLDTCERYLPAPYHFLGVIAAGLVAGLVLTAFVRLSTSSSR